MLTSCNTNTPPVSAELHNLRILYALAFLLTASAFVLQIPLYDQQALIIRQLQEDVQELKDKCRDDPKPRLY